MSTQYVIVHSGNIISGPRTWNKGIFEADLQKNGINSSVSRYEPENTDPVTIDDKTTIKSCETTFQSFNPKIEMTYGPFVDASGDIAQITYKVKTMDVGLIRGKLKQRVSAVRSANENAGTTVTIDGTEYQVATDRETRNIIAAQIATIADGSVNWKFGSTFVSLNKAKLESVLVAINTHVQEAFTAEKTKYDEIDAASTADALDAIVVGDEPKIEEE